jgi:hypothetical protein
VHPWPPVFLTRDVVVTGSFPQAITSTETETTSVLLFYPLVPSTVLSHVGKRLYRCLPETEQGPSSSGGAGAGVWGADRPERRRRPYGAFVPKFEAVRSRSRSVPRDAGDSQPRRAWRRGMGARGRRRGAEDERGAPPRPQGLGLSGAGRRQRLEPGGVRARREAAAGEVAQPVGSRSPAPRVGLGPSWGVQSRRWEEGPLPRTQLGPFGVGETPQGRGGAPPSPPTPSVY